ncbi:hypothetical protein AAFH96_37525, partial [Polymorphospora sp. 2-325]
SAGAPPVDLDGDGIADVDPETGQPILAGGSETDLVGSATEVAAFRQDGTSRWLPLLAAGLVLLVVLLPALVTRSLARRPEPRR